MCGKIRSQKYGVIVHKQVLEENSFFPFFSIAEHLWASRKFPMKNKWISQLPLQEQIVEEWDKALQGEKEGGK